MVTNNSAQPLFPSPFHLSLSLSLALVPSHPHTSLLLLPLPLLLVVVVVCWLKALVSFLQIISCSVLHTTLWLRPSSQPLNRVEPFFLLLTLFIFDSLSNLFPSPSLCTHHAFLHLFHPPPSSLPPPSSFSSSLFSFLFHPTRTLSPFHSQASTGRRSAFAECYSPPLLHVSRL